MGSGGDDQGGSGGPSKRVRHRTARVATQEMISAAQRGSTGAPDSWVVLHSPDPHEVTRRHVLDPRRGSLIAGRNPDCDLVVDSQAASRKHVRLEWIEDAWWAVDLKSLNGTWVNDARVSERRLEHGDRVQVGEAIFKHLSGAEADAAYAEAVRAALTTDGLTQLLNDRALRDELDTQVARAAATGAPLALVMADVDHFKSVNDRYGHFTGDRVLRTFAAALRDASPEGVYVGRVGGEEFALLAPFRDLDSARAMAEKIRAHVERDATSTPAGLVRVTASFGVAVLGSGETAERLFARADAQLYRSKRGGRNRVSG